MDATPVGRLGAEAMERVSEHYGDDATVRLAALLLEIDVGDSTEILVLASDDRPWVQIAFVDEALGTLEDRRDMLRHAEED